MGRGGGAALLPPQDAGVLRSARLAESRKPSADRATGWPEGLTRTCDGAAVRRKGLAFWKRRASESAVVNPDRMAETLEESHYVLPRMRRRVPGRLLPMRGL